MVTAPNKYGAFVEAVVGLFLKANGNNTITAEEAKVLFAGEEEVLVKDLTMNQLLQVLIVEAYAVIEDLQTPKKPNRATRRSK